MKKDRKRVRTLKEWAQVRQDRHRKLSTWRQIALVAHIVVWLALTSIVIQLLYPGDRALPGARVEGQPVGFMTSAELIKRLEQKANGATLRVQTPDKARQVSWATIGATIDRESTVKSVLAYNWWERLIPFSMAVRATVKTDRAAIIIVDQDRLKAFAAQVAREDRRAAKEASIIVEKGELKVDEAKAGYVFDQEALMRQILASEFKDGAVVRLAPRILPTVHESQAVAATARQAQQVLERRITLAFAGQNIEPDRATVGEWLRVKDNSKTLQLELSINKTKLKNYLGALNEKYAKPPVPVTVTLLDNKEVSRTTSKPGRAMNVTQAIERIELALLDRTQTADIIFTLPIEAIEPPVTYKHSYSSTNEGLSTIIRDWERTTYGDFGVVIREVGGQGRYAAFQADKKFVTASTYKMFLVYVVLKEMEAGRVSGGQKTDIGWTVDDCITEMIIHSTNPCAISLQNLVGWVYTDQVLHQAGFTDTVLDNRAGVIQKTTTVRDEANFLLRLNAGGLLSPANTERLLGLMKRQVWRGGIPTGVPGVVVANKVGFYNGWVHDVAIVYGPKGTYILAIMSKGGSDPGFADLSRRVYDFFN